MSYIYEKMKLNRVPIIVGASTVALIALVVFQMNWIKHAHDLIEEQFEQKVRLALCAAIESVRADQGQLQKCVVVDKQLQCQKNGIDSVKSITDLDEALSAALSFYDVNIDYEFEIVNNQLGPAAQASPYCCSLSPLIRSDEHLLVIRFPGKTKYISGKMGFMMASSIIILIFLTMVFILANYTLIRQKRLSEVNRDFFNNMAHELRTPLTNISLAMNLMRRKRKELNSDQYANIIHSENNKLKDQVERMLHLARLENGEYQLQKEPLQIGSLLRTVLQEMDIRLQEQNARIELDLPVDDITIYADKFHLSNAFRNLLDNALKYCSDQPLIKLLVQPHRQGVSILLQDNGIGLSPSQQKFIFDKFHRVSTGNRHDRKGFGLGLAYVKMIVERHQGGIEVFSELNKGSRFDLFFPIAPKY